MRFWATGGLSLGLPEQALYLAQRLRVYQAAAGGGEPLRRQETGGALLTYE